MNPFFATPLAGAIATGLGSLGSALAGNSMSYGQSKDLMKYQFDLNQQAIAAQNEYNTPANQMKRLEAAGLNPNLVYGSGVDGNQSSAPSVSQANRRVDLGNPLGDAYQAYIQGRANQAAVENTRQGTEESKARTLRTSAETLGILNDNKYKDATLDARIAHAEKVVEQQIASINKTYAETSNIHATANKIQAEIDYYMARTGLTKQQILTEACRPEEIRAHAALMRQQKNTSASQSKLYNKLVELNDEKIAQMSLLFEKLGYETDMAALEDEMMRTMSQVGLTGTSPAELLKFFTSLMFNLMK